MKKNIIIVLVLSLWFMSAYWLGSYYLRAQVVGVAVQKYVDVLDAESTDPQFQQVASRHACGPGPVHRERAIHCGEQGLQRSCFVHQVLGETHEEAE